MKVRITSEQRRRYEIETQAPAGALVDVTVSEPRICEGEGCYNGMADIHAHVTARWENGAVRREPIPLTQDEQREWILRNRRDLFESWQAGDDWMWNSV